MMDNNFKEIDVGINIFDIVPFEIAIIYTKGAIIPQDDGTLIGTHQFVRISEDKPFFAESYGYWCFEDNFRKHLLFTEGLKLLTINNIQPYYDAYADAFYKGYGEYDIEVNHSTALFNNDIQTIANRVFRTIITPTHSMASTGMERKGAKFVKTIKKSLWCEAGRKAGEKYKAWYFIINNPQLFTNLFRQSRQTIVKYNLLIKIYKNRPESEGIILTLEKLIQDINSNEAMGKNSKPDDKPSYSAKDYALAYFLDCEVTGNKKYMNQTQAKTESDLYQYSKGAKSKNTIRKALDDIKPKGEKIFDESTLIDIAGEDWRIKIMELSKSPDTLKTFLQSKQL